MTKNNKSTPESSQGTPTTPAGTDGWVMKSINGLRDDIKSFATQNITTTSDINSKLGRFDERLSSIEAKISRLIWVTGTVGVVLATLTETGSTKDVP